MCDFPLGSYTSASACVCRRNPQNLNGEKVVSKQLLIYRTAVPLSAERHRDWSVRMTGGFGFAAEINSVPLLAAEFIAAADLPIIFAGEGKEVVPAALLGFAPEENLMMEASGQWRQAYVPAFLRRYPFVFSESEDRRTLTLCIDEEFEGLNTEGRGERLFDAEGNRTQFLEGTLGFVSQYQAQFNRTRSFCERLVRLNLLKPAQARRSAEDGAAVTVGGFSVVDRERLKSIADAELRAMFDTDELELVFLHLHSLGNVQKLARLVPVTSQGDAPGIEAVDEAEVPVAADT